MTFRHDVPQAYWPYLLEDVQVQQSVRKHKTPDALLDDWLDFARTQCAKHPDSKDRHELLRVVQAIEEDPQGAAVFFANVHAYVTRGVVPKGWNEC